MNKNKITLGKKCIESYPDRIPIIATLKNENIFIGKFLIPNNITITTLMAMLRRKCNVRFDECLSIEINNLSIASNEYMSSLFMKYKNQNDGCLHIIVNKENIYKRSI